jgi:hypothetical protein
MVARAVTERGRAWARVQAFLGGRVRGAMAVGALSLPGCVIELPEDRQHPCEDVRCSIDGYCRDGACYCDTGYLGNPYALRGCQSARPGADCTTTCGLNAYCDDRACVCEEGFLAVCGTGDCLALRQLCDGVPDCANMADEAAETCARQAVQQWTLLDDCDDGIDVEWRLWSRDRDWAWPGPDEAFFTDEVGVPSHEEVECLMGEVICFGALAGELEWGVGVDGTATCDGCCFVCSDEPIDLGGLACE